MPGSSLVQSLLRGIDIVELLSQSGEGLSLRDIASAMRLKAPTAHNLVRTLQARGFVDRQSDPVRYRVGARVAMLGNLSSRRALHDRAAGELRHLASSFPQAIVTLAERAGSQMIVTLRIDPAHPGMLQRPQGLALNLYATASGLVCQAWAAADDLAAMRMASPFWETGAPLWKDTERLDAFLSDVRAKGCASGEFKGEGVFKVGAPVFGRGGDLDGVLGSAIPAAALEAPRRRELIDSLVAAARRISAPDESGVGAQDEGKREKDP